MKKFKIKKWNNFLLLCVTLVSLTSCSKCEKEELETHVYYEIQVPSPILKIADVYAVYTDASGQEERELLKDGYFAKSFLYKWQGKDEINNNFPDFSIIKIETQLKVDPSSLKEGTQLLNDPKAFYKADIKTWYTKDDVTKKLFDLPLRFTYKDGAMSYSYSVAEQIQMFKEQSDSPLYKFTLSRVHFDFKFVASFNTGSAPDAEEEDGVKKEIRRTIKGQIPN